MKPIISNILFTLSVFLNSFELSLQSEDGVNLELTLGHSHVSGSNSPSMNGRARLNGLVASPTHASVIQHRIPTDGHGWITIPDFEHDHHPRGAVHGQGEPGLSGIPRGSYPIVHLSEFIFYQAGPHDFRIITGSLPVVVRGNYIIGRFDNGYLRPILNHRLDVIKVHRTDNIQVLVTPTEYKQFGMNRPITRENTVNYRPSQPETIVLDD